MRSRIFVVFGVLVLLFPDYNGQDKPQDKPKDNDQVIKLEGVRIFAETAIFLTPKN